MDSRISPKEETGHAARRERRTQSARRSKSDRRLIGAALKLIAANGADRTSLAEIGIAAGYSRGLPGERFGSKQRFLETIVDNMSEWFAASVEAARGDKKGLEAVRARIGAHFDAVTEAPEATRSLEILYIESLGPIPELKPRMIRFFTELQQGLAAHLVEAQELGEIDPGLDCTLLAETWLSTMRGIVLQSFFYTGKRRLTAMRAQYMEQLESFLRLNGGGGTRARRRAGQ